MQKRIVKAADGTSIQLHQLRPGVGPRLLMLHGVGRAARTFSALAMQLPSRFDVWAADFRGHGHSGQADNRYRVVDYLQDAIAALQAAAEPAVVYGHSLGSLVAAALAAECPSQVAAVLLEDPPSSEFWNELSA